MVSISFSKSHLPTVSKSSALILVAHLARNKFTLPNGVQYFGRLLGVLIQVTGKRIDKSAYRTVCRIGLTFFTETSEHVGMVNDHARAQQVFGVRLTGPNPPEVG